MRPLNRPALGLPAWLPLGILLIASAAPEIGHAQVAPTAPAGGRLTGGVLQPDADGAADHGAQMVEVNPAGLGFGSRFDLGVTYTSSGQGGPGEGFSLFGSVGALDPYHTGFGVQLLDPAGDQDSLPAKVSWSHALRLGDVLSVGFTWHTFVADENPSLDGLDTWDLGLQVRPSRWLAAGLTITDLTTPLVDGVALGRGYEGTLAFRPGTDRATVSVTGRLEGDADLDPAVGARLNVRLFGGLALVGRYDALPGPDGRAHRVMLGLADLGRFGLGLFGYAPDASRSGDRAGVSVSARLRSQTEPLPPLIKRRLVAEITVGGGTELQGGGLFSRAAKTPFLDTLLTLRALERDEEVAAVIVAFGADDLGWAQAAELRTAIASLRARGKQVWAWLPTGRTKAYSVAAAADRVFTAPAGGVMLTGLDGELIFLGDLLQKLGVRAQFVGIGDYKTAPEQFTRSGPSPANEQMTTSLLDDLYQTVVGHIAQGRHLKPEQVRTLIDQGPYTAREAEAAGLVDGVMHYDEFEQVARDALGGPAQFRDAAAVVAARDPRWGRVPAIGVLYAVGTITDGDSVSNPLTGAASTGADSFIRAARALRLDSNVRAVVLRIDSPGGSVTAADAMWRELSQLAKAKPLIVSMGDVAASGGYYIAAPARAILASPESITGSIGIFTGKFDLTGLYDMIGVDKLVLLRGKRAGLMADTKPWDADQIALIRRSMGVLYDLFLDRVVEGRPGLDRTRLEPLARGRVWTGQQARACGLIDRRAGLLTAIDLAAVEAGLGEGDYRLLRLPASGGFGGLPRTPVSTQLAQWLVGPVGWAAQATLPAALRRIANAPLLRFESGQALALWPVVGLD